MNNDQSLIAEAYSRVYLKEDADFPDNAAASEEATLDRAINDSIVREEKSFGGKYSVWSGPEYYTNKEGNRIAMWTLYDKTAEGGDFSHHAFNFTSGEVIDFQSGTAEHEFQQTLTPVAA
jgi:hypothetical protein